MSDIDQNISRLLMFAIALTAITLAAGVAGGIWSVYSHITALSAHVEINPEYSDRRTLILKSIEHELRNGFHITHTTLQMDCSCNSNGKLIKELRHTTRHGTSCGHDHKHNP